MRTLSAWKQEGRALFVSAISRAEVLSYSGLTDTEIEGILAFLQHFVSVPFDDTLAERAARIRRRYRMPLPDGAIAATALVHEVPLVTRDQQFRQISEPTLVEL